MALSSRLQNIHIRVDHATPASGDWEYKFTINSMVSDIGQVNYGSSFDEGLDGSLRHNLRGFRLNLELNWEKLLSSTDEKRTYTSSWGDFSSSTVSAFLTDLVDAFVTDSDEHIEVSFDGTFNTIYNISSPNLSTADHFRFVLDNSTFKTVYNNQIGRGSSSLKFVGKQILTGIPAALEAPSV